MSLDSSSPILREIEGRQGDEAKDKAKYAAMAQKAPSGKSRSILEGMSQDEGLHQHLLSTILTGLKKGVS